MFVAPDGRRIFFASNRSEAGIRRDNDLWSASRSGDGWGVPRPLDAPVNSEFQEWLPSVAANGNLYFQSDRPGGQGGVDLYVSRWEGGQYAQPELLGGGINTEGNDESPYIAPDESYLIFSRHARTLHVSFRDGEGWSVPRPIRLDGETGTIRYSPYVSPDGKYLFYTSNHAGTQDIYQVDFDIEAYRE